MTKGTQKNRFVYTFGLAACGLLDFCWKKKSHTVKWFAKLLISRFRKLVFFIVKEMWHL